MQDGPSLNNKNGNRKWALICKVTQSSCRAYFTLIKWDRENCKILLHVSDPNHAHLKKKYIFRPNIADMKKFLHIQLNILHGLWL